MSPSKLISKESLLRWGSEFVVVFLGVSLAFVADNYRDTRIQEAQAQNIYRALSDELQDHSVNGQAVVDWYTERRDQWKEDYDSGKQPIPWFIPWNAEGPPMDAWNAAQSAGGISLLRSDIFFDLIKYYRMAEHFLVAVDGRDEFAEEEIIPFTHLGSEYFYTDGELLPKYQAYLDRRDLILVGAQRAIDFAQSILTEIDSEVN